MPKPPRSALALIAVVVAVGVGAGVWVLGMADDCLKRWKDSGFEWEWRDGSCMVLAGSKWIPDDRVVVHVQRATPD
jgi:hypothetical protein